MTLRTLTGSLALLSALALWPAGPNVASAQDAGCATSQCVLDMAPPNYLFNNDWGNRGGAYGSGSIIVHTPLGGAGAADWSTAWDYSPRSEWSVISYPSAVLGWEWGYRYPNATSPAATGFPVQVNSGTPITTTIIRFTYTPDPTCYTGTRPRTCRLDVAYDAWFHNRPIYSNDPVQSDDPVYELMIWVANSSELYSGTTPTATNIPLAGKLWDFILQNPDSTRPIAVFKLKEGITTAWSAGIAVGPGWNEAVTLNITDFTDWLSANAGLAHFNPDWWIDSVQFGPEIYKGKGTLDVVGYTAVVGGTLPPPPTSGPTLTVTKAGTGGGTVTSAPTGISCGSDCTQAYQSGTVVILSAAADPASIFDGWSNCSSVDSDGRCTVTLSADTTVTASFTNTACIGTSSSLIAINAGGVSCGPYVADTPYASASNTATNYSGAIDRSQVTTDPAPVGVYQSERYGNMTYTIGDTLLAPGQTYTVRLHFAENYWSASGKRKFNVAINGATVLRNFDVFATAGGAHRALVKEFAATANSSGQIVIKFTTVINNALINGIQIK
jgi:hypothetical protein